MKIKLGTRKSPLALAQANEVTAKLQAAWPHLAVEQVHIVTSGDKFTERPLADVGGKGLFTKEIEEALLSGDIDIAVHSMKDMPTILPDGLVISAMLPREDVRDMLVGEGLASFDDIPQGAVLGTASLRRAAQVKILRPDVQIVSLRGNVQTRLTKLAQGNMRATILAKAGLNRLKLEVPGFVLSAEDFIPAVAQGAIGIECRENDTKIRELLVPLSHRDTEIAAACERAFLRVLDGSCRTPIAGYAEISSGAIHLRGLLAEPDGSVYYKGELRGDVTDAESIGIELAKHILAKKHQA